MVSSTKTPTKKAAAKPADHPKYSEMILAAMKALSGGRKGTSKMAVVKYVQANYKVNANCLTFIRNGLKRLVETKQLVQVSGTGATGSFKLPKPAAAPKKATATTKKPAAKTAAVKKPAAKKSAAKASPKKKPAAKKPAVKKPVKKAAVKKTVKAKKPTAKKAAAKKTTKAKK